MLYIHSKQSIDLWMRQRDMYTVCVCVLCVFMVCCVRIYQYEYSIKRYKLCGDIEEESKKKK